VQDESEDDDESGATAPKLHAPLLQSGAGLDLDCSPGIDGSQSDSQSVRSQPSTHNMSALLDAEPQKQQSHRDEPKSLPTGTHGALEPLPHEVDLLILDLEQIEGDDSGDEPKRQLSHPLSLI
jgi:hypothetical protein